MTSGKMRLMRFFLGFAAVMFSGVCFADAATQPGTLGDLINNIQSSLLIPLLNVIVAVSYLAGAGFVVGAIFKFKAHKDNPTQVTVGAPVMLLFVGVGLLLFPSLIGLVTKSMGFTSGTGSLTYSGGGVIGGT